MARHVRSRLPFLAALALAACSRADRIELAPATVRFVGVGKSTEVHASPFQQNGRPIPDPPCAWSSSDERVVKVAARQNLATVTSAGPGTAAVRCKIGDVTAELPVQVRTISRLTVRPERLELTLKDQAAPFALEVTAYDDQGAPVVGRPAAVLCQSEEVCRGDGRAQVWAVGPGETTASVELDGARVAVPVKVVDARSPDAKPKLSKENPMLELERIVKERDARRAKEAEKAAKAAAKGKAK
jgi:hypothetical protein